MTRAEVNAALLGLAEDGAAAARVASARVESGAVCDSWFLGDDDACGSLRGSARRLVERAGAFRLRMQSLTRVPDGLLTQKQIDDAAEMVDLIASEARTLGDAGEVVSWSLLARTTLRDVSAFVASAAGAVVGAGGNLVGSTLQGLIDGLGPLGFALLALGVYTYATRKAAS